MGDPLRGHNGRWRTAAEGLGVGKQAGSFQKPGSREWGRRLVCRDSLSNRDQRGKALGHTLQKLPWSEEKGHVLRLFKEVWSNKNKGRSQGGAGRLVWWQESRSWAAHRTGGRGRCPWTELLMDSGEQLPRLPSSTEFPVM